MFCWKPINTLGIHLANCNLEGHSLHKICLILKDNTLLKSIDLDFSGNQIAGQGIKGLFILIDSCKCLQSIKLNLAKNQLNDEHFVQFLGSTTGFNKNTSLKKLDLNFSGNKIKKLGMLAFWKHFKANSTIEELVFDISGNFLTEKGFDIILQGIKEHRFLKEAKISISDQNADFFNFKGLTDLLENCNKYFVNI